MKVVGKRLFLALLLCLFVIPILSSSKAHAAPAIASCTSGNLFSTTTVSVPGSTETWECYDGYYSRNGTGQLLYYWTPTTIYPSTSYWTNLNTNMELDVRGASTSSGAPIEQWPYNGQLNQQWYMSSLGSGTGTFHVVSQISSSCMGVQGSSTAYGASVVQWACNGHDDQLWRWVWTGNFTRDGWPIWNIVDDNSGLCLGISGGSLTAGALAVQWTCNGNADQSWY